MPWRGYRGELLVVVLVAVAALGLFPPASEDRGRFALTQAIVDDGSLVIDRFVSGDFDKARYDGHFYSLHAPGVAFGAVPAYAALEAIGAVGREAKEQGVWTDDALAWTLRILTSGLCFIALLIVLGRLAEGLVEGTGAATVVSFGLGTLALQLAPSSYGHVAASAFAFGGFVLAWAGAGLRRAVWFLAGGLCLSLAVAVEYQAVMVAALVLAYVGWKTRALRPPLALCAGMALPAVLLAAYHWAAFGGPFRSGYRYVDSPVAEAQRSGFYGIRTPDADNVYNVLLTRHGLVTATPVLVLAAIGLVMLWRSGRRAEAAVCGGTAVLFLVLVLGYFGPYGGAFRGPRFFAVAYPFLLVGLPLAFQRWPRATAAAALFSIVAMASAAVPAVYSSGVGESGPIDTIRSILGAPPGIGARAALFAIAYPLGIVALALALLRWPRPAAAVALCGLAALIAVSVASSRLGLGAVNPTIWSIAGAPRLLGAAIGGAATVGAIVLAGRNLRGLEWRTAPVPAVAQADLA